MNVADLSLRLRELVDDYSNQRIGHDEYRAQRKVILDELDMIIVTTADPMQGVFGEESWKHEGEINRLVGSFIGSLPMESND